MQLDSSVYVALLCFLCRVDALQGIQRRWRWGIWCTETARKRISSLWTLLKIGALCCWKRVSAASVSLPASDVGEAVQATELSWSREKRETPEVTQLRWSSATVCSTPTRHVSTVSIPTVFQAQVISVANEPPSYSLASDQVLAVKLRVGGR